MNKHTSKKLLAFRLRFEGLTYSQISQKTGYSEFSLRKYFAAKGKWHAEYKYWADELSDTIQEETKALYQRNLIEAAHTIILTMNTSSTPSLRLKAAKDILDRCGFTTVTKMPNSDPTDWAEELLTKMENLKSA